MVDLGMAFVDNWAMGEGYFLNDLVGIVRGGVAQDISSRVC